MVSIRQLPPNVRVPVASSASPNQAGAYYSLDWGRMLLPSRGQIFGGSVYKTADVNNHVIGRMQSTGRIFADDVIYQIYTYSQKPYDNSRVVYLVGQMFVPKLYGNILLCRTGYQGKSSEAIRSASD